MSTIVYSSAYVPPEWIASHGLRPLRYVPGGLDDSSQAAANAGRCPWARAFCEQVPRIAGTAAIVVGTICDQIRRASEQLAGDDGPPVMLFNLPATWKSVGAQRLYRDELRRLGRLLERVGGTAPSLTRLADVMNAYEQKRQRLVGLMHELGARQRAEAIAAIHGDETPPAEMVDHAGAEHNTNAAPVALVGSAVPRHQWWIDGEVEQLGGTIALDATDYGERGLPSRFDRRLMRDDPFEAMAAAYFDSIPHAGRRPNTDLYEWLRSRLSERGIRGIIVRRCTWCDLWHAEVARLREWVAIPVLDIDFDEEAGDKGRALGRIQAFMEMLG